MRYWTLALFALCVTIPALAGEPKSKSVEQIAAEAKDSIAVLLGTGRDGKQSGLGTGFAVAEGLIATNLHVIGEGRPIRVQLADGSKHEVTAVHAWDRKLDLAVVRVDAKLKPLPLGENGSQKQGQAIVALGHPRGLEHSVVAGVLSGTREVDGMAMLQLAIPIESGNSGGPVLDSKGRVLGIVTMKSLVTNNLGFAVPVDALKPLLARPNSVPMDRWLALGALDQADWKTSYGGRWRQRAGRIMADGTGTGFGGRTLCFWQHAVPPLPFEISVAVKLDDEAGAAGLIFGGDDADSHFGFYPSGGKLRLTRFAGPNVFSWKILHDQPHAAYRPGEWNQLKVRVEKDKIACYVNEELAVELADPEFFGTTVGLAKFRDTIAEYKRFQVAAKVTAASVSPELRADLEKRIAQAKSLEVSPLLKHPAEAGVLLRERARALEHEAAQLRKAAAQVHHEHCLAELARVFRQPNDKIDLLRAALWIARIDNEELDVEAYLAEMDRMAAQVALRAAKADSPEAKLQALSKYFFEDCGFHGSHHQYYSRSNSYLNEVIDDREGLPITLSLLYLELARRLDLKVVGVPLPAHFMVRFEPAKGEGTLIDVFDQGKHLTRKQAEAKIQEMTGTQPSKRDFQAVTKQALTTRILHNLLNQARREKDPEAMLRYLDALLVVDAEAHEERWARAVLRFQAGRRAAALEDCELLLEKAPDHLDLDRVRDLVRLLNREPR